MIKGKKWIGWSNYNEGDMLNGIWPVLEAEPGKILVFRTHDGNNYVKVEILNFYGACLECQLVLTLVTEVFIHLIMFINQMKIIQCFN